jgi:rubredoxin
MYAPFRPNAKRTSRCVAASAMIGLVCAGALIGSYASTGFVSSPLAMRTRSIAQTRPSMARGFSPMTSLPLGMQKVQGAQQGFSCPVGAPMRQPVAVYAAKGERTIAVDKPLGLKLGQTANGLVVKSATGNAAKAGLKNGDTVIYTSSFFGDELWPSDKLSFTNSAIKAAPSPVYFVITDDPTSVDVKRLNARPPPKRFGKRLSQAQKELATHICLDCGYIYCDPVPFAEADNDYVCPQCASGKKRFATFDASTGKITEPISLFQIINVLIVILGLVAVAGLGYFGLKLS